MSSFQIGKHLNIYYLLIFIHAYIKMAYIGEQLISKSHF